MIAAYIIPRLPKNIPKQTLLDGLISATALAHGYGIATNHRGFELIGQHTPGDLIMRVDFWTPLSLPCRRSILLRSFQSIVLRFRPNNRIVNVRLARWGVMRINRLSSWCCLIELPPLSLLTRLVEHLESPSRIRDPTVISSWTGTARSLIGSHIAYSARSA